MREEIEEDWRKLHNGELNNLQSSSNIIMIKSRTMRWGDHLARMGESGGHIEFW
jgi:hypothetical protein